LLFAFIVGCRNSTQQGQGDRPSPSVVVTQQASALVSPNATELVTPEASLAPSQTPGTPPKLENVKIGYLNEAEYKGEKKELVNLINLQVKYFNERNVVKYKAICTKGNQYSDLSQLKYDYAIIDLKNVKFYELEKDHATIFVNTTWLRGTQIEEGGDFMYSFQKENGEWKISDVHS
jgi:hypothetical protein